MVCGAEGSGDGDGVNPNAEEINQDAMEDEEYGQRVPRKAADPRLPTQAEIESHRLTHLPFRNWCSHCIKGRGREAPHRRIESDSSLPELNFDFCFLGQESEAGKGVTVLVVREKTTKMVMSTVVPTKAVSPWICRRLMAFLKELGLQNGDVILKSDQEPSIKAVIKEFAKMRAVSGAAGRCIEEESPVGSSSSNGIVETAIHSVERQVGVIKEALQER